jgi:hypothetical protein
MTRKLRDAKTEGRPLLRDTLISGALTALTSAIVLAACGKRQEGSPFGPLNGPSQWLWGEAEAYRRHFSMRNTVIGYVIHHLASTMWAGINERLYSGRHSPSSPAQRLAAAAATTALAYVVDYKLTPRRFRPGFKKHLDGGALTLVYVAFGIGMSLWPLLRSDERSRRRAGSSVLSRLVSSGHR